MDAHYMYNLILKVFNKFSKTSCNEDHISSSQVHNRAQLSLSQDQDSQNAALLFYFLNPIPPLLSALTSHGLLQISTGTDLFTPWSPVTSVEKLREQGASCAYQGQKETKQTNVVVGGSKQSVCCGGISFGTAITRYLKAFTFSHFRFVYIHVCQWLLLQCFVLKSLLCFVQ